MDNDFDPVVGNWYTLVDDEQTFIVLAVDQEKGVVEVRYEDGEIEELELGDWPDLDLEPTEPPEGYEAAADDELEGGSLGGEPAGGAWVSPGQPARPRPGKSWEDPDDEDEEDDDYDDWGEEADDS